MDLQISWRKKVSVHIIRSLKWNSTEERKGSFSRLAASPTHRELKITSFLVPIRRRACVEQEQYYKG